MFRGLAHYGFFMGAIKLMKESLLKLWFYSFSLILAYIHDLYLKMSKNIKKLTKRKERKCEIRNFFIDYGIHLGAPNRKATVSLSWTILKQNILKS